MASTAPTAPAGAVSMQSLENAFKKTLTIAEKTQDPSPRQAGVIDPKLSEHLQLPQYAGSFLSFAVQDAYRIFLQDLEDVNGGKEIPMNVAAAAWVRLVGQKFKEWDAASARDAGKSSLLAKIMRQARPGEYTTYRRSKMSKEDLKALVANQSKDKTKHQGVLDGMAKFARKARKQQRREMARELRQAKSVTSTLTKSMGVKKHKKPGMKTKTKTKTKKERKADAKAAMALKGPSNPNAKQPKNDALAGMGDCSSFGLDGKVFAPGGDIDMQM